MSRASHTNRRAFSLIELVIVIIIMGVISAIAIPRMMRGAEGADITGLQADLAVLRNAIEMYRYEHSAWPLVANFEDQLTTVTGADGNAWSSGPKYGPYMVKLPPLKTGNFKGQTDIGTPAAIPPVAEVADKGWLYDQATGSIWANDATHMDK